MIPRNFQVDYAPGAHPGWDDYWFTCQGHRWRLLVIRDADDPRSQISREDSRDDLPPIRALWPHYLIMSLPCVITPEAAYVIITNVVTSWNRGIEQGQHEKLVEIKQALSL